MPELPEVETVRRGIERTVVGRRVMRVEVGRERTVRRTSRRALIDGLTDTTVVAADRRGKYLLCPLDSGDTLMVHLRMSGRLLTAPAGAARPAHTHVVAHLAASAARPAEELWFVDPRTFGEMVVFDPGNAAAEVPELGRLGRDPVIDGLSTRDLQRLVAGRRRQLKALLLDQHVLAGVGNIYADESLHRARLRPDRTSDTLTGREIGRLASSVVEILSEAIDAGGSTLADTQYVDLEGNDGWFQVHHRVYDRAGERCLTCGRADIVRAVTAGRSTCWCPRCQR
ncbi:MAG: formamidopyrimidine-DNA glycosylase/DNA-(apurinic or apyrimidinic site) lyase [Actinomycetota bacterium]|jgi:formamidopyrimidine-DNA glycosylase